MKQLSSLIYIDIYILEQPDSPSNILAAEIGSRTISLRWTQPYDGNSPIVSYKIQYKLSSGMSLTFTGKIPFAFTNWLHKNVLRYFFSRELERR